MIFNELFEYSLSLVFLCYILFTSYSDFYDFLNFQQIFGNSLLRKPASASGYNVAVPFESYQNIRTRS